MSYSTGVLRVFRPKTWGVLVEVFELRLGRQWVWCWSRVYSGDRPSDGGRHPERLWIG
jgi:hypothetical protein